MCSRLLGGALLLVLAGRGLAGQTPVRAAEPGGIRQLEVRADSLARLWDEANALAILADGLAHGDVPGEVDTLKVGSLRIIANRSSLPLEAAAERAWPRIDSLYGSAATVLEQRPYLIHAIDPDSQLHTRQTWGTLIPWDKSIKETTDLLWVYVPMPASDPAFKAWSGNPVRPTTRGARQDLEQSYVALVTSHYSVSLDCFLGSIESCRSVLELDDPADPIRVFHTPDERRAAIKGVTLGYRENELRAVLVPCSAGIDSACVAALRLLQRSRLPPPIAGIARETLVRLALRLGGREAYARLMADSTAPMPVRLSAASGLPLDSLLSLWRSSVIAARPKPVALPPFGPLVGLGWVAVFGACALRSSRWRVA
jgi:hypothetical protein